MSSIIWVITIVYLAAMLGIGFWASKKSSNEYENYTIGAKKMPFYLIMFTFIASVMGAGNFLGHADKGYTEGLTWLAFVVGEQGVKVVFALVMAGFLAKFSYKTVAEFMQEMIVNDKVVRILVGILTALPGVAWVGAQAMGIGLLYKYFVGADPTLVIWISAIVFIIYTTVGGFEAVVWTDLVQGLMVCAFAGIFYYAAFSTIDFNMAKLGEGLTKIDPKLWSLSNLSFMKILNLFIAGALGNFMLQIYWQRSFAARNHKEARWSYFITGCLAVGLTCLTAMVGMIARYHNPNLTTGVATWLMKEMVSPGVTIMIFMLIIAATMSSADSLLNSAAVNVVHDIILPLKPELTNKQLVKITMIVTAILGLLSVVCTMYFKYLIDLAAFGYTISGATLFPLLAVGLLWKKDSAKDFAFNNSRVTPLAAQVSLILGGIVAVLYHTHPALKTVFGGGVIPGAIATTVLLFVISTITKKTDIESDTQITG